LIFILVGFAAQLVDGALRYGFLRNLHTSGFGIFKAFG